MNIHVIVKFCNKLIITDRKTLLLFFMASFLLLQRGRNS